MRRSYTAFTVSWVLCLSLLGASGARDATVARFDDGITVEILGITKHKAENGADRWWNADGSPLDEKPCDRSAGRGQMEYTHQLCLRATGMPADADVNWLMPMVSWGVLPATRDGAPIVGA